MAAPLIQASDVAVYAPKLSLSNSADNAVITLLAGEVSDMARSFCDREWWITPYSEQYYGKANKVLLTKQREIKGVTNVTVGTPFGNVILVPTSYDSFGNPIPSTATSPASTIGGFVPGFGNFWYDKKAIYLGVGSPMTDSIWPNIYVQYTAGYASQTGGTGAGSITITRVSTQNTNANFLLPSTLTTISVQGTATAPSLIPSTSNGTLAANTYYVIAAPIFWAIPGGTPTSSLILLTSTSGGPQFAAFVGTATAQSSVSVTGSTGSIAASIASPPTGLLGYLWAIGATSGGPYTVFGLSTGSPDYGSIPADVKMALIKETTFRYEESKRVGLKTVSDGNQQTSSYNTGPMDPQVMLLLKKWRRTWSVAL